MIWLVAYRKTGSKFRNQQFPTIKTQKQQNNKTSQESDLLQDHVDGCLPARRCGQCMEFLLCSRASEEVKGPTKAQQRCD